MTESKLVKYVEAVQSDSSRELLIDITTGELWDVDTYALRERGMPEDRWGLYSEVSKEQILYALQKSHGINRDADESS